MGIPLETKKPTFPAVKLPSPGDYVDIVIAHVKEVPWYEYDPRPGAVRKQRISRVTGKPQNQEVIVGIVVGGKGALTKDDQGNEIPAADRAEVAIYAAGHKRWSWIEAKKAHLDGLNVGDRLRWKYERDEQGEGAEPKKAHSATLRSPKPDEAADVAAAEALYARITAGDDNRTRLDADTQGGGYAEDEEPF